MMSTGRNLYFALVAVPIAFGLTATGVGALLQLLVVRYRRAYPPGPGRRAQITSKGEGTASLKHLYYRYETATSRLQPPRKITVLFEAASGMSSASWYHFQRRLAEHRIPSLCYDRAGYGWSDSSCAGVRDAVEVAQDLDLLVNHLHISPPFLVCGIGVGAEYALAYAMQHSDNCRGVVLVDPSTLNAMEAHYSQLRSLHIWVVTGSMLRKIPFLSWRYRLTLRLWSWFVASGLPRLLKWLWIFDHNPVPTLSLPELDGNSDSSPPKTMDTYLTRQTDGWKRIWAVDPQILHGDVDAIENCMLVAQTWSTIHDELSGLVEATPHHDDPSPLPFPASMVSSGHMITSLYGLDRSEQHQQWLEEQKQLARHWQAKRTSDKRGEHSQMTWSNTAYYRLLDMYEEAEAMV